MDIVYIASPLFSEAEQRFNLELASYLSAHYRVFLPQRDGDLLANLISSGMKPTDAKKRIFDSDMTAIHDCAVLVAVLDGRVIDEGVSFELGVAYTLKKPCVGLQTDPRRLLGNSNNPMIDCSLSRVCRTKDQLLTALLSFQT